PPQDGDVRPGDDRGHEHFGFKDGISQPGIAGLTNSSKTGQDEIAAGEFLVGYANQDGQVSGQEIPAQPIPSGQPGYPGSTPEVAAFPPWTKNGSFVVYRRLFQNVPAFTSFLESQAATLGLSADQLGAKLVGR